MTVVTPPTMLGRDSLLVKLSEKANLRDVARLPKGAERKTAAFNRLTETAATSQKSFVQLAQQLQESGAISGYETLISPNALLIDPASGKGREMLETFGTMAGVEAVYDMQGKRKYYRGSVEQSTHGANLVTAGNATGIDLYSVGEVVPSLEGQKPYGVQMVGAPQAWEEGADGTGLVFGSIDTGAAFEHEALADKYRGNNGDGTFTHDYSWFDFGSRRSESPKDSHGHGTHTIGTTVGGNEENPIGVAPKAKWISVPGLQGGLDVRLKAIQFMQAPTKLDGTAPRPELAPDVVGMSWWTGPNTSDVFKDSMENLKAAGIEPVKSMGNAGPKPESGSAPGGFDAITSIAAVDKNGDVAKFSSRGPSAQPHHGDTPIWKPDFAAPGVDVISATPGNNYRSMSGTSMAQPHFSGVLLAVMSKFPQLTDKQLETVLINSSTDAGAKDRDLEFGHGIVNIPRALEEAAKLVGESAVATAS